MEIYLGSRKVSLLLWYPVTLPPAYLPWHSQICTCSVTLLSTFEHWVSNPFAAKQLCVEGFVHFMLSASGSGDFAFDQAVRARLWCINLRILPRVLDIFVPAQVLYPG